MIEKRKLSPGERVALERKIQQRMTINPEYKAHVENKLEQIKTKNIMSTDYQKFIYGDYRSNVLNCIKNKMSEIKEEYSDILKDSNVDFDKTFSLANNDEKIWFVNDENNSTNKVPYEVLSKVNLVIGSCLEKYSSNKL